MTTPFAWILDTLPALISYIDPQLRYVFANDEYRRWFGADSSLDGRAVRDVLGDSAFAAIERHLRRALSGEMVEYRTRLPYSPRARDVHATYVPHVLDGRVVGVVAMVRDCTAEVHAAAELAESEERLQLAVAGARMGTWFRDYESGAIVWNEYHSRLLGVPPGAHLDDREWLEAVHPDDREAIAAQLVTARAAGAHFELEARVRRRDSGELRWLAIHGRYRLNASGAAVQSLGVVLDVTERKLTELKIRRSEARMRLFGRIEESVRTLADPTEIVLVAIEALREHLGADRCAYAEVEADEDHFEFAGVACAPGVPSVQGRYPVAAFGARTLAALRDGRPGIVSDAADLPDGADRAAFAATGIRALIAAPLHKHGRFVASTGVHMLTPRTWTDDEIEVTVAVNERIWESVERARTARALARREAEFRALFELSLVGMVEADLASQRMLRVNERMCELSGYTAAELVRTTLADLTHPEDRERADRTHSVIAAGGDERWTIEKRLVRRDGTTVWVQIAGRVVAATGDTPARTLHSVIDISPFKHAEARLRDADLRKDAFLATLAHELRNPLAPIRYASRLFRPDVPPDVMADAGRRVDRQLAHLTRLLDDLLDVSRITRGLTEIRRDRVDLRQALEAAAEAAHPLALPSGHRLAIELPPQPVWVVGDLTRLVQIVGNLLGNAIKYSPAGSAVRASLQAAGEFAVVSVRDEGIGIPPEAIEAIFELFRRGSGDRSHAGGLGIGLALARELARLHGGDVHARSSGEGRGSEFTLQVPLAREDTPDAAPRAPAAASAATAASLRVLVVDDNADAAISLSYLLEGWGHRVRTAFDGPSGLETGAAWRPDVLLLDIGMPGMSGHEVARRARAEEWGRGIAIVAVTGWGQPADRLQSRLAGCDHHLTKPVDPAELQRLLATVARVDAADALS